MHEIREDPVWPECCDDIMPRTYRHNRVTDAFAKPIEMFSVACNTSEEENELKRKCPDVEMRDGVPIARTRTQKKAVLDAVGFEEKT